MFDCPGCGSRIDDVRKRFCGTCGANLRPEASPLLSGQKGLGIEEKAGICVGNICLSPLLGTVLYFVWKDDKPAKADDVCMVTIASLFVGPLIAFILYSLGIVGGL
ncbi:MAG: hypothetical protein KGZ50_06815 [Peptococcaceae bacterium]|nr:hypothetical protein [Peptococcaceae bacterium]